MKKIIRLTESDLVKIVKKVISESNTQIDEDYFFENPTGKFKSTCFQINSINGIESIDNYDKIGYITSVDYLKKSGQMSTWGFCLNDCSAKDAGWPYPVPSCCYSKNTLGCKWPTKNEWNYKYDASKKIFWLERVGGELKDMNNKEVKLYAPYKGLEASMANIVRR